MYDINKFLENIIEIYSSIERQELLDGGTKSGRIEINETINNVDFSAEVLVEQYDTFNGMESIVSVLYAYYITSEGDEIPCTDNEIEIIKNVIKSLL